MKSHRISLPDNIIKHGKRCLLIYIFLEDFEFLILFCDVQVSWNQKMPFLQTKDHFSGRKVYPFHSKTNFSSVQHRNSSWMDHLSSRQAIFGLIVQSSQLYNIPLDGKTNFWSVQHRISSWISHLSGRQACPLHGKTNFRSIQHRISSWMDHLSSRQAIFGLTA